MRNTQYRACTVTQAVKFDSKFDRIQDSNDSLRLTLTRNTGSAFELHKLRESFSPGRRTTARTQADPLPAIAAEKLTASGFTEARVDLKRWPGIKGLSKDAGGIRSKIGHGDVRVAGDAKGTNAGKIAADTACLAGTRKAYQERGLKKPGTYFQLSSTTALGQGP
eukprot:3076272-Rhodomonas_salina.1